jgi:GNAT superfamily N-acetyltransferase
MARRKDPTMLALEVREPYPAEGRDIVQMSTALASDSPEESDPELIPPGVRAALERPELHCTYFVAVADGQVVGQVMRFLEWNDLRNGWTGWIRRLYVRPSFRRNGIGEALVRHVIEAATEPLEYRFNVHHGNEASARLFETLGFRFVARHGIFPVGHSERFRVRTTGGAATRHASANNMEAN